MAGENEIEKTNPYAAFFGGEDLTTVEVVDSNVGDNPMNLPPTEFVSPTNTGPYKRSFEPISNISPEDVATFGAETAGAVYGGIRGAQLGGVAGGAVAGVVNPALVPYGVAAGEVIGGAVGSGVLQTTARTILEEIGIAERTSVVQKGDDIAQNIMADLVLETAGRGIAGRVVGPAFQRVREAADNAVRGLQWEDAITNAFVKNREEFNKFVHQGIGGDSLTAIEAFTEFGNEVIRPQNWQTRDFRKNATLVFKRTKELHEDAKEAAYETINKIYDATERMVGTGQPLSDLERQRLIDNAKALRASRKSGKAVATTPVAPEDATQIGIKDRAQQKNLENANIQQYAQANDGPSLNSVRNEAVDAATAQRLASSVDFTFSVKDLGLEETFSELTQRSLAMRYEMADAMTDALATPAQREALVERLGRTEKGATSVTRIMRKEIDGLYLKHAPKSYTKFNQAKDLRKKALKKMEKLDIEMDAHILANKSYTGDEAKKLKDEYTRAASDYRLYDTIAREHQDNLKNIRLTGKELLEFKRALDAISAIPQRASAWNLESRMTYEANLAMSNTIRGKLAERISEVDPEMGVILENVNQYYGMLKRVEPDVLRMAEKTPSEMSSANGLVGFIRSFFLPADEVGQFKLGTRMYGAVGTMTAPALKAVRAGAAAGAEAILPLRKYPGLISGLSYPISEAAEPVLGFNIDEHTAQFAEKLAIAAGNAPTTVASGVSKAMRSQYLTDVLQGRGNTSTSYAITKTKENSMASMPQDGQEVDYSSFFGGGAYKEEEEEEKTSTTKVEMEDTGLGTKKRKEQ